MEESIEQLLFWGIAVKERLVRVLRRDELRLALEESREEELLLL